MNRKGQRIDPNDGNRRRRELIVTAATEIRDDEFEEVFTILEVSVEQTSRISTDDDRPVTLDSAKLNMPTGLLDTFFQ